MNENYQKITVNRDCDALLIPTAVPITIPADTEVYITQTLGGTYTVNVNGNLARIDGDDADALGFEKPKTRERRILKVASGPVDKDLLWAQLREVYDPEIPVNIVELGLIYECDIVSQNKESNLIKVQMTLTAPGCSMGPVIANDVESRLLTVPNVTDVKVEIVFDPPWNQGMMSDAAKLELGMF